NLARSVQIHHDGVGWPGRGQTGGGTVRLAAVAGLLSFPTSPNGYALAPVWVGSVRGPLYYEALLRRNLADLRTRDLRTREEDPMPHGEEQVDYSQIDSVLGGSYCSPSLSSQRLPPDFGFAADQV